MIRATIFSGTSTLAGVTSGTSTQNLTSKSLSLTFSMSTICTSAREATTATEEFKVKAYQNPSSNVCRLEVQSSSKEITTIQVYDMTGLLIENLQSNSNSAIAGKDCTSDMYNVIVNQVAK